MHLDQTSGAFQLEYKHQPNSNIQFADANMRSHSHSPPVSNQLDHRKYSPEPLNYPSYHICTAQSKAPATAQHMVRKSRENFIICMDGRSRVIPELWLTWGNLPWDCFILPFVLLEPSPPPTTLPVTSTPAVGAKSAATGRHWLSVLLGGLGRRLRPRRWARQEVAELWPVIAWSAGADSSGKVRVRLTRVLYSGLLLCWTVFWAESRWHLVAPGMASGFVWRVDRIGKF